MGHNSRHCEEANRGVNRVPDKPIRSASDQSASRRISRYMKATEAERYPCPNHEQQARDLGNDDKRKRRK